MDRKSREFKELGEETGQCPVCLHVYPLLSRAKNGSLAPLCPLCDCVVEEAGKSNVSRKEING